MTVQVKSKIKDGSYLFSREGVHFSLHVEDMESLIPVFKQLIEKEKPSALKKSLQYIRSVISNLRR